MLNHKQCDAFLAVAETGSFDLAAEQLYITASAVTLRVQSLEKSLGHLLIVRERPCRPTQAGQSLLHYLQHSRLLANCVFLPERFNVRLHNSSRWFFMFKRSV